MAGRLTSFKYDIEKALKFYSHGSSRYVQEKRYVLFSIAKDLQIINCMVPTLKHLNKNILLKLIAYWRSKKNAESTIIRKITILRKLINSYYGIVFPPNEILGLKFIENVNSNNLISHKGLIELPNEYRLSCKLQYYFGLKFYEAIKIKEFMFEKNGLLLPRSTAYNNKDRFIPFWNEEQLDISQKRMDQDELRPAANLFIQNYKINLAKKGISHIDYYRHHYIYNRYLNLNKRMKDRKSILLIIRNEVGNRENRQIKRIIACLSDF